MLAGALLPVANAVNVPAGANVEADGFGCGARRGMTLAATMAMSTTPAQAPSAIRTRFRRTPLVRMSSSNERRRPHSQIFRLLWQRVLTSDEPLSIPSAVRKPQGAARLTRRALPGEPGDAIGQLRRRLGVRELPRRFSHRVAAHRVAKQREERRAEPLWREVFIQRHLRRARLDEHLGVDLLWRTS